jgi:hypothetical protein
VAAWRRPIMTRCAPEELSLQVISAYLFAGEFRGVKGALSVGATHEPMQKEAREACLALAQGDDLEGRSGDQGHARNFAWRRSTLSYQPQGQVVFVDGAASPASSSSSLRSTACRGERHASFRRRREVRTHLCFTSG